MFHKEMEIFRICSTSKNKKRSYVYIGLGTLCFHIMISETFHLVFYTIREIKLY